MEEYRDEAAYHRALKSRATPPKGFRFAISELEFDPIEKSVPELMKMNLSAILLDEPTPSFGGVFTKNAFPGAPIHVAKKRMRRNELGGIIINNKIANVCTERGVLDAERVADACAKSFGLPKESLIPASTGIIGWRLPVEPMLDAIGPLTKRLGSDGLYDVSRGIMTTDSFPKLRSAEVGGGRIVGVAKGAGMIEPNMATLLVFLCTDLEIPRERAQSALESAVARSFNLISIDSDQSTSDMAILLSSNKEPLGDVRIFEEALVEVCRNLAFDVVRNGEGTEHVIRVSVEGAPSEDAAIGSAKAIVNSPLVKTAICGNDPNVGRIVMALGDYVGASGLDLDTGRVTIAIGTTEVFSNRVFCLDPKKENLIAEYLSSSSLGSADFPEHDRNVEITIDLGAGKRHGEAVGSDLTHGYVRENADYRS